MKNALRQMYAAGRFGFRMVDFGCWILDMNPSVA